MKLPFSPSPVDLVNTLTTGLRKAGYRHIYNANLHIMSARICRNTAFLVHRWAS